MCRPASFVLTKNEVFFSHTSNAHENIIREYDLHADGARGPNILRVEIVPPDGDYASAHVGWDYHVDQDILPDWASAGHDEQRARSAMDGWRQYHCCTQTAGYAATQTAGYAATQKAGYAATQKAGYAATQKAGNAATQTAGDDATQTAGDDATQTAGNAATQTAGYAATQKAGYAATQTAGNAATQTAGDDATQTAGDAATQKAGYAATQTAGNAATQTAGKGTVQIGRWYTSTWMVAVRVVTAAEANKWYRFEDGVWRECTPEESAKADRKVKNSDV